MDPRDFFSSLLVRAAPPGGAFRPALCPAESPEALERNLLTRLDPLQRKSARTTSATERLNEGVRRRIKTQIVLPCAEIVPMLL